MEAEVWRGWRHRDKRRAIKRAVLRGGGRLEELLSACIGELTYCCALLRAGREIATDLEHITVEFMGEVVSAIEATHQRSRGWLEHLHSLTPREIEVLSWLDAGFRPKHVAEHLVLSIDTVNMHIRHAANKLGVHGYGAAVRAAREWGILGEVLH